MTHTWPTHRALLFLLSTLTLSACGPDSAGSNPPLCPIPVEPGEPQDQAIADCIVSRDTLRQWIPGTARPTVLFVDRSGSMTGFLDPNFPTQLPTDFRFVLDGILSRLKPSRAFLYGTNVEPVDPTLGTLGKATLYSDNNTNMEKALDSIAADTALLANYLVVGDGRRGDPNVANEQYTRIRNLAGRWIDHGGVFAVAASRATFKRQPKDVAGCSADGQEGERSTCPLYAFAFAAPGNEASITSALADVFDHLFIWPVGGTPSGQLELVSASPPSDMVIEHHWKPSLNGQRLLRLRTKGAPNKILAVRLTLSDSTTPIGRAKRAVLRGQAVEQQVWVKPLTAAAATLPWIRVTKPGSQVRSTGRGMALELMTNSPGATPSIYRIDFVPTGGPSWLEDFDAPDRKDSVRTFGLGSLFRMFATKEGHTLPAARFYIVAN